MHDKNLKRLPRAWRRPARNPRPVCGSALLVCRQARKRRKLLFHFPSRPSHAGMHGMRCVRVLPHTFGGSELAKVGVVVHAPHEVLPARRRRRRRREWPTSLSLASRPVAGPPVLPGTDSLSCTQRTQRTQRHVTQCATSLMRIWTKKVSESEKWIWLDCWSSGERSGWGARPVLDAHCCSGRHDTRWLWNARVSRWCRQCSCRLARTHEHVSSNSTLPPSWFVKYSLLNYLFVFRIVSSSLARPAHKLTCSHRVRPLPALMPCRRI